MFWAHRAGEPLIGKCLDLAVEDAGVVALPKFAGLAELHPDAERTFRLYRDGFLTSWSVGINATEKTHAKVAREQTGATISRWELLEYSAVGVPSNPHAVTRMLKSLRLPDGADERDVLEALGVIPLTK